MTHIRAITGAALIAALPTLASADGARDWLNVPVDTNFLYFYYTYSDAETAIASPLPVEGASVNATVPILRYARSLDLGGRVGGIQFVLPYASIDAQLDGTRVARSADGLGDLQTILIANIYGAPALSRADYAQWVPGDYLTASLFITSPTGDYDASRLVNPGKNRWSFKPQISWGRPLDPESWLALNANAAFFTDNDDYLSGHRQEQAPLLTLEAHYSRNLSPAFWLSGDAYYSWGGETRIDGVKQGNRQSTLRLGISGTFNLTPADAIAVAVTTTAWKRDETPSAQTFSINYNHAW